MWFLLFLWIRCVNLQRRSNIIRFLLFFKAVLITAIALTEYASHRKAYYTRSLLLHLHLTSPFYQKKIQIKSENTFVSDFSSLSINSLNSKIVLNTKILKVSLLVHFLLHKHSNLFPVFTCRKIFSIIWTFLAAT